MIDFVGSFCLFIGVVILVLYPCLFALEYQLLKKDRIIGSYRRYERASQVSFIKSKRRGAFVALLAFLLILLGEIPILYGIDVDIWLENPFGFLQFVIMWVIIHVIAIIFIVALYFDYKFIVIDRNQKSISIYEQMPIKMLKSTFQFESIAHLGLREVTNENRSSPIQTHSCEISFNDGTEFLIEGEIIGKDTNIKFLYQLSNLLDTTIIDYTQGEEPVRLPDLEEQSGNYDSIVLKGLKLFPSDSITPESSLKEVIVRQEEKRTIFQFSRPPFFPIQQFVCCSFLLVTVMTLFALDLIYHGVRSQFIQMTALILMIPTIVIFFALIYFNLTDLYSNQVVIVESERLIIHVNTFRIQFFKQILPIDRIREIELIPQESEIRSGCFYIKIIMIDGSESEVGKGFFQEKEAKELYNLFIKELIRLNPNL